MGSMLQHTSSNGDVSEEEIKPDVTKPDVKDLKKEQRMKTRNKTTNPGLYTYVSTAPANKVQEGL